jgi:hypothetical protein
MVTSDARKEDVGLPGNSSQIRGAGVAQRDSGVLTQKEQCCRLASSYASSYDYRILSLEWNPGMSQQLYSSLSGAGNKAGKAYHQAPGITRAKTVNVLLWRQHLSDESLPDMPGKR